MVIKCAFVGKKNFDFINMHGTTIKKTSNIIGVSSSVLVRSSGTTHTHTYTHTHTHTHTHHVIDGLQFNAVHNKLTYSLRYLPI